MYITFMNFKTITYSTMDLAHPTPAFNSGAALEFGTHGGAISGFLVWLRLWFETWAKDRLSGISPQTDYRPPSLLPDSVRASFAPRMRANRKARRIMARGIPASRGYAALHHLNGRRLTFRQFMERACKLSTSNRIVVYWLSGRKRLCQCRESVAGCAVVPRPDDIPTLNLGLCAAHLWPS